MEMLINDNAILQNPLTSQLKMAILRQEKQSIIDINKKYTNQELHKKLRIENSVTDLLMDKLEYISKIDSYELIQKYKCLGMIHKININEDFTAKRKLRTILSYGVLVNKFADALNKLTDEENFSLSLSATRMEIDAYDYYFGTLTNKELVSKIVNSGDLDTQQDVINDIFDVMDAMPHTMVNPDNYQVLLDAAFEVTRKYSKLK